METTAINDDDRGWNVQLKQTTQIGDLFPDKNCFVDRGSCCGCINRLNLVRAKFAYGFDHAFDCAELTTVNLRRYHNLSIPFLAYF